VQQESCGKCVPCRIGTRRMLEMLTKITRGEGKPEDIDRLARLGEMVAQTSLCGLGQTAPNPVLSTIRHFRGEYEEHTAEGYCPAHECRGLFAYEILADKCTGCHRCYRECPQRAISGEVKHPHVIDQDKCIQCGICFDVCRFSAIIRTRPARTGASSSAPRAAAD